MFPTSWVERYLELTASEGGGAGAGDGRAHLEALAVVVVLLEAVKEVRAEGGGLHEAPGAALGGEHAVLPDDLPAGSRCA